MGAMKVPARAFALPTGSAAVTEALLIAPESTNPTLEYCRVRATIAGGGLNGVLIEATGAFKRFRHL